VTKHAFQMPLYAPCGQSARRRNRLNKRYTMISSHPPGARVSQTRSFSTVFLIEMWERFGYYGMAALLVLFIIDKLHFTDSHATLTWGGRSRRWCMRRRRSAAGSATRFSARAAR
jgi:hypothetical protein